MRICLVSQEYPPDAWGGIATQTQLKARGLAERGHEVHVLSASDERGRHAYAADGATIHRVPEPELPTPGYEPSTYWLLYSAAVAAELQRLSEDIRFEIVHFPEYGAEGFVYQTDTFRYRTARYVVQLHGPLEMFATHMGWPDRGTPLHEIGCFMERMVIRHADALLASSHTTADFCAERYGCSRDDIRVIHSAIDTARFAPGDPPADLRHPRLLFVGNLARNKGVDRVSEVVLGLVSRYPDIHLRLIGRADPAFEADLRARIAAAGGDRHFELLGEVPNEELPAHYRWSDFFVGPSEHEPGPGNVYLEAMACSKPVIAGRTGGAPEAVVDGETGLLVDPLNLGELEQAIIRLADDRALRARLGRNGRRRVEDRFSVDRYIGEVERLYAEIAARTRDGA